MRVPQVTERIKEAPVQALRGVLAGIGQVLLFTDKLRNKNAPADDATSGAATATAVADPPVTSEASAAAEAPAAAESTTSAADEAAAEATPAAEAAPAAEATPGAEAAPAAEAAAPAKAAAARSRRPRKPRDLDKTGNVRILTEGDAPSETTDTTDAPEATVTTEAAETVETTVPIEAAAPTAASAAEAPEATAPAKARKATAPAEAAAELPLPTYDDLSVASIRARLRNLTATQVATLADYEKVHAARPDVITMFERRIAKLEAEG